MEIAANVHVVTVGQGVLPGLAPPNVYLVTGTNRTAFIDTAYGHEDEVRAQLGLWEGLGKPEIAAIILTHRHPDHIGGAGRLQQATGGQIVSSPSEKESIEHALKQFEVGRVVADGETLDLGGATLELIHTPGHTMGSLCVFYREGGVLFTGDTILGSGSVVISPDHGDMQLYIQSLRKLLGYDARVICPGHGSVVNQPRAKIEELIEHRLDRERQVLRLLQRGQHTTDELLEAMYPELDSRLHDSARRQIRSHLMKLESEGKVLEATEGEYALK